MQTSFWLPEPNIADYTYARRGEHTLNWLERSTLPLAREYRRFLNENIAMLTKEVQDSMRGALRTRWDSAFFEVIVARLLQELGATIIVEDINAENKRPDFTAMFEAQSVIVEAISPHFNIESEEVERRRIPLLDIIAGYAPEGWYVGVEDLPQIGPMDSKKEFKRAVKNMLSKPPPTYDGKSMELVERISTGVIRLHLLSGHPGKHELGWEPPITILDNSEARIRYAIKDKRRQIRSSDAPVLLAIQGSGIITDFEDFDKAIFGKTFGRYNLQHELIETGFHPDGAFMNKESRATYAGILAFLGVNCFGVIGPVLYRHPKSTAVLPEAILKLEQRRFDATLGRIEVVPPRNADFMKGLGFVNRSFID